MNWRTGSPPQRQARRARPVLAGDDAAGAQIGVSAEALRAAAAKAGEARDDMVARPHRHHVAADRLDHAGAFMAEHDRPVERPAADPIDDMKVAVADTGRHRAHQHLMRSRFVEIDGLDGQRFVRLAEDRGLDLHGGVLATRVLLFAMLHFPSSLWGGKPMPSVLEEKDAIREVLARYCFALDGGKFVEMAALFSEDGTWHTFFGKATGRAAIAEFAAGLRAHRPGPTPRAIHHVTNVVITLDGDSAKVRSNWTTVQNAPEGPKIGSGGAYYDDMVKIGGNWFFRYRTIVRYIRAEHE